MYIQPPSKGINPLRPPARPLPHLEQQRVGVRLVLAELGDPLERLPVRDARVCFTYVYV